MNPIVFVMMVYSHGLHVMPSLEFTTSAKCEAAAAAIVADYNKRIDGNFTIPKWKTRLPYCIKVEK